MESQRHLLGRRGRELVQKSSRLQVEVFLEPNVLVCSLFAWHYSCYQFYASALSFPHFMLEMPLIHMYF